MTTQNAPVETVLAEMIMTKEVLSFSDKDTMRHVAAVMLDKNISGAPVLDDSGRPVGVITKTDIVRYEREYVAAGEAVPDADMMRTANTLELIAKGAGFHRESAEDFVAQWMTPRIYSVGLKTPVSGVLGELSRRRVHRVFVVDEKTRKISGVITTFDLMQYLAGFLMCEEIDAGH